MDTEQKSLMKELIIGALIVIAAITIICVHYASQKPKTPPPPPLNFEPFANNSKPSTPRVYEKVILVNSMMEEYRQTPDRAKKKYDGHTLFVWGRVTSIKATSVVLENTLACYDFEILVSPAMHIGQKVIIKGRMDNGSLHECVFMD